MCEDLENGAERDNHSCLQIKDRGNQGYRVPNVLSRSQDVSIVRSRQDEIEDAM